MAVVPTGNPAWNRTNDHVDYGGDLNKINYESQGAVNPRTDLTAEQVVRIAADMAAVMRASGFATITLQCNDTVPAAPTILDYDGMFAPPIPTRNGNGDVTLTWLVDYADEYGVIADTDIKHGGAQVHGTGNFTAAVELLDPDLNLKNEVVRVRSFAAATGVALIDPKLTVEIA